MEDLETENLRINDKRIMKGFDGINFHSRFLHLANFLKRV